MPAAAVIPAPIAYIKVVAVKKLVVEFLEGPRGPSSTRPRRSSFFGAILPAPLGSREGSTIVYCEKIRVFKASFRLEYISME